MPPPLPVQKVVQWTNDRGCAFAYDAYYVSNLKDEDLLREANPFLRSILGEDFFVQIIRFETDCLNTQTCLTQRFDGEFSVTGDTRTRTMRGNYLRIISAFRDTSDQSGVIEQVGRAINLLRLNMVLEQRLSALTRSCRSSQMTLTRE